MFISNDGLHRENDIENIANGKYCIDMRGTDNWSRKVDRLREILKLAAPLKTTEPLYRFTPYYYCKDGYWYESNHASRPCLGVFDIYF